MIGHYVNTLSLVEENRLLTTAVGELICIDGLRRPKLGPPGCILQVAHADVFAGHECEWHSEGDSPEAKHQEQVIECIGAKYDELLARFGAPRLNAAIRNRILSNRAARVLGNAVVYAVPAPQEPQSE